MAYLSIEDRQRIWRGLMRYWSNIWNEWPGDCPSSVELLTTVNEVDTWIDNNQVSYKSSLTYGDSFNPAQKTLLFCCVAAMRVSPAFCRMLLGNLEG